MANRRTIIASGSAATSIPPEGASVALIDEKTKALQGVQRVEFFYDGIEASIIIRKQRTEKRNQASSGGAERQES